MLHLRRAIVPRRVVAVLAALVVCLTCLPGVALCVGSDHLAVEPVGSDCGPPAPAHARDAAVPAVAGAESLHGCTDTLLGAPSLQTDAGRRVWCTPARLVLLAAPAVATVGTSLAAPDVATPPSWSRLSPVLLL